MSHPKMADSNAREDLQSQVDCALNSIGILGAELWQRQQRQDLYDSILTLSPELFEICLIWKVFQQCRTSEDSLRGLSGSQICTLNCAM
nr:hypothetical protein CKG001_14790 [Bdellovibrio sp. CKG001]